MAFPYVEGSLGSTEAATYREHLRACPICRAEVDTSDGLVRSLRRLPDPNLGPGAASAFDAAVLEQVGVRIPVGASADVRPTPEARVQAVLAAAAARRGRARVAAGHDARSDAARAIAARSRQAARPDSPPAPSFMLAALALAALSFGATVLFGEWMVRAIGTSFTMALGVVGEGGGRLAEVVGAMVLETVAVIRVLRVLVEDVGPLVEGMRQFTGARGAEVMLVSALAVALLGLAGFIVRRGRSEARESVRE